MSSSSGSSESGRSTPADEKYQGNEDGICTWTTMSNIEPERQEAALSCTEQFKILQPRYKLERNLGKGAYGEVYKAVDLDQSTEELTKYVAIKFMQGILNNQEIARKVTREVSILRELSRMDDSRFCSKLLDVVWPSDKGLKPPNDFVFLVLELEPCDLYDKMMGIDPEEFST
mmetsp:Transcript_32133/g.49135  ORF Transcript_32133/g.49135 Transcript_32133/m.49135 type:complete len:173 (+) Transcript_32133:8-526(+)|eukprot:CAMPEP_0170492696 /NCGR_PEP_ID=MMETSP0208-20121228/12665_1 /TAXON_ID=197538 /ORGANISM="Strombidium inclinatum, Strain S3" /LENGTH=172 /DNA_ID=CAMNT_0010768477 /DNA_START=8 /DNA_END=526 /DNA_ORIENTATION=-